MKKGIEKLVESVPVRICAYTASWLSDQRSFANKKKIGWSTSPKTRKGDVQVFAVSTNTNSVPELHGDPRVDAVVSIWKATADARKLNRTEWPDQCDFKLLVKLETPVSKRKILEAGVPLGGGRWPQGSKGQRMEGDNLRALARALISENPRQRDEILNALGVVDLVVDILDQWPGDIADGAAFVEGAMRQIIVNAYERSPEARKACIANYGTECVICGVCLGDVYGKAADGLIHVHHLHELSGIGKEYVIDPINDLRPVCPNCHAVLHLRKPAYTIEEMKGFLRPVTPRKIVTDHHRGCPKCGSIVTIPVVYGYASPELLAKQEKGLVKLGGCCLESAAPDFSCMSCGHEWKKEEIH
jgi:hypothetical protein